MHRHSLVKYCQSKCFAEIYGWHKISIQFSGLLYFIYVIALILQDFLYC